MRRLILLFVLYFGISIPSLAQNEIKTFKVFNCIQYLNTPDFSNYGFQKFFLVYEQYLLTIRESKKTNRRSIKIGSSKFDEVAKAVRQLSPNIPVCLDIESWKMNTPYARKKNTKFYKSAISQFRALVPGHNVNLFYYHIDPDKVIYPSFYTSDDNKSKWKRGVITTIEVLRKKFPDIKIYAFIWPQYAPKKGSTFNYKFIPSDYWRFELETLYKYADGVVIWTQYQANKKEPISFYYDMPWFQETIEFMKEHSLLNKR